jgi:hypothetical protein
MMTTRDCSSNLMSVINSVENGGELRECVVENLVQNEIREEEEEEVTVEEQNGAVEEKVICDVVVAEIRQEGS